MKHQEIKHGRYGRYGTDIRIYNEWVPNEVGHIAVDLMKHLAICTGTPDGEDSAGRSKLKLLPADEVAKRACDIAAAMEKELKDRGWRLDLPEPKPPKEEENELGSPGTGSSQPPPPSK